jgi:16S rRNA (cytosine967-C5)-methyltransferase
MPSSARVCAFAVQRRTFEHGAYTDQAFNALARSLGPRNRALAMHLAYGSVQRRLTLDHLIAQLAERPVTALDAPVRAALRIGVYELLWGAAPARAVVHDAVELAKSAGRGAALVNAVLRRAAREGAAMLAALRDDGPATAALKHSLPVWITELWWDALGRERTLALMQRANEPAENCVRANTLVTDATALSAALPVANEVPGEPPEAVVIREPFDAHGSALWRAGALMPQSRAAMLVGHAVDPPRGGRVLDLCAAPGGKTTHLAALMSGEGTLVAVERHAGRARSVRAVCERMRVGNVEVRVADAGVPVGERFDCVLLDPPCSGLGTLQSRPDLRWRASLEGVAVEQARLLSAAATAVAVGGTLVYSTCTISPPENERQIEAFLDKHPEFAPIDLQSRFSGWAHPECDEYLLALPSVQGSDGFFIAALQRQP